jgi:pimeloyl-ACP methyl ester carboxylesterase
LFFVPGLMASHLKTSNEESGGSRRIWLDYDALAVGELDKLDLSKNSVSPDGVIAPPYQRLIQHLSANYEVLPFAYDWRLSVDDSARQLAEAVRMQLERHRRPIRFLAHSTGGLVVRAMITHFPELWDRLIQRDTRLVMLGTPNQGSFVTLRLLLGREKIMRLLALLDGQQGQPEILNQFRAYPGLLELLPPPTPHCQQDQLRRQHQSGRSAPAAGCSTGGSGSRRRVSM